MWVCLFSVVSLYVCVCMWVCLFGVVSLVCMKVLSVEASPGPGPSDSASPPRLT